MEEVKYIWKRMSNNNNEMVKERVSQLSKNCRKVAIKVSV